MSFTKATSMFLAASVLAVGATATTPSVTAAQEVTLKLHNFLSPRAIGNRLFMKPWAEEIAKATGGKLKIQIFPAMQLGGKPKDLVG